jgi:hypothetical protein
MSGGNDDCSVDRAVEEEGVREAASVADLALLSSLLPLLLLLSSSSSESEPLLRLSALARAEGR